MLHPDQKGFVKGRNLYDLTYDFMGAIDLATTYSLPLAAMTLDATKAFDRVNWVYLSVISEKSNLGERFCRAIQLIYRDPSAKLLVNGNSTGPFKITRGTRQGCPLSPFLFDLYIKPFTQHLREDLSILPLSMGAGRGRWPFMPMTFWFFPRTSLQPSRQ